MGNTRERLGAAVVTLVKVIFRIVLYICVAFLIYWGGKAAFHFAYTVFNEQAVSPGEGEEVVVAIEEGSNSYQIGKTLENAGLIENALIFVIQERLSNYHGQLKAGTYSLSTAYTPTRIMSVLAEEPQQEGMDQGGTGQ